MRSLPLWFAATFLLLSSAAEAHPKLVSASSASNVPTTSPAYVQLRFSEKLVPAFSKADLFMVDAKDRAAMKIASAVGVSSDGHTLVITPRGRLPAGPYNIAWRVASMDTHRIAGGYAFSVR